MDPTAPVEMEEILRKKAETEAALEARMNEICVICNGKRSEHKASTKHMFTKEEGQLITPQQAAKMQAQTRPATAQVVTLPGVSATHPTTMDRLIQVMLQKNLLTKDEALFVLGVGPEPQRYRDPAAMMTQPARKSARSKNYKMVGGEPTDGDDSGADDSE